MLKDVIVTGSSRVSSPQHKPNLLELNQGGQHSANGKVYIKKCHQKHTQQSELIVLEKDNDFWNQQRFFDGNFF